MISQSTLLHNADTTDDNIVGNLLTVCKTVPYSFSLNLFTSQTVSLAAFKSFLNAKAPLPLALREITACILANRMLNKNLEVTCRRFDQYLSMYFKSIVSIF